MFEQVDALEAALKVILATAQPPWWRLDRRLTLKKRKAWVMISAFHQWPQWYSEAIKCGADPELLTAVHLLIFDKPPPVPHDNSRLYRP